MVYELCEEHGYEPTPDNYYAGIKRWLEDGQAPRCLMDIGIEVNAIDYKDDPYNTCRICDRKIIRNYTYCNDCDPTVKPNLL